MRAHRQQAHAVLSADDTRGDEGRYPQAHGNQDAAHPEIQQGQGRRDDGAHQGRNRGHRPRPRQYGGGDGKLVHVSQGKVRQEPPEAHRDKEFRHHRGDKGGGSKRKTVYQQTGGLRGHRTEEGRIRVQLLRHRRHHHLLPRRKIQGGEGCRQDFRREEHHPRGSVQEKRQAHDIQRGVPRR